MFNKSKLFRILSLSLIILCLSAFAFADTIRLKDGSIIKGTIVSFGGGQFVIVVGDGARQRKLNFFADEIESIEFDSVRRQAEVVNTSISNNDENKKPAYTKTTEGNNTVITVNSTPNESEPEDDSSTTDTQDDDPIIIDDDDTAPANSAQNSQPIVINTKVLADNTANGWTNSGWVVRKGQKIRITGSGRVSLGNGRYSSSAGISTLPDPQKLLKEKPTGGLIAVIGDDNNDFIFIGEEYEFVAERDGALFLGINEGVLTDNSGAFDVNIEIDPELD
ncbi:MAG: LecA/PA-IL family lectin [Pyrinomonadaceae bacterium]